jgi:hypothetical protein
VANAVTERGKNWVAFAFLVPGRSNVRCRERWVNCLGPAIVGGTSNKGSWKPGEDGILVDAVKKLGQWTSAEDAKLTAAVKEHGDNNWVRAAALVPGRTNKQCNHRWVKYLGPDVNTGRGTAEEDAKLAEAVKEHGDSNWTAVAAMVPGRTNIHCRLRWVRSSDPDTTIGKWTVEEIAQLTEAVTECGTDWVRVAVLVPGRTHTQCYKKMVQLFENRAIIQRKIGNLTILMRGKCLPCRLPLWPFLCRRDCHFIYMNSMFQ